MDVIYVRASQDRAGAGVSVARQEKECRALGQANGVESPLVLTDNDVSASDRRKVRKGYQELMAMLREGSVASLTIWHNDRLHRQPRELEEFIDVLEDHPVPIHTVAAGQFDLSTPSGRLAARVIGAAARYEQEHKASRQKAAYREKARNGEFHGGTIPYGYKSNGISVDEAQAQVIRDMVRWLLAGKGLHGIAVTLNENDIPAKKGGVWSANSVRAILTNPRIAGLRTYRGEVVGKATWEPIISEEDFYAVKSLVENPARRTSTTNVRKHLLTNIAKCGVCGAGMVVAYTAALHGRRRRAVYRCRKHASHVVKGQDHVDALVEQTVIERLKRPDALDLLAPVVEVDDPRPEIEQLELRLAQAAQAFASGTITLAQLESITATCQEALGGLRARQANASRAPVVADLVHAEDVEKVWQSKSLAERRAVIDALIMITINRSTRRGPHFDIDSVQITWK